MKARLVEDGRMVELVGGGWWQRFPVEHLGAKLRLYTALRDRGRRPGAERGPFYRFYAETVAALEALRDDLRGPTLPGGGDGGGGGAMPVPRAA